ncbi:MAG: PadR family transcriptional regulator [Deltaproteobacteria bacterium CG11_big_fil_rev_8_21_14_0_20_45_16]|nr:MAG: PadR family transcriptional regulator [Deltaproteobacteria bacterium CG11_big_fil_rev_8_21_14_0_20_45_16]
MELSNWRSQLRKGFVEFSLLRLLRLHERLYGLEILERLNLAGIEIGEGTLYPLLSRLVRDKLLLTQWEIKQASGHPRKYYKISAKGGETLARMSSEWESLVRSIKDLEK